MTGELYEFYGFHLYLEQILMDEDQVETRLRCHRTLNTPLLPRPVVTENQTALEEHMFTVYLGDVPTDVKLAAVHLNGQLFTVPFTNASRYTITQVDLNDTHGYTLTVPFDDPAVIQQVKIRKSRLESYHVLIFCVLCLVAVLSPSSLKKMQFFGIDWTSTTH